MTSKLALVPLSLAFALAGCPSSTVQPGPDSGADAAGLGDAGAGTDAATTSDAGTMGNGVICTGSGNCAPGEVCCGGSSAVVCQAASASCDGPTLACDGSEDCPGAHCCQNVGTTCAASCTGGSRICHASSECETGQTCCPNGGAVPQGQLMHCTTLAAGTSCPLPP
jgi:hypothetical protein